MLSLSEFFKNTRKFFELPHSRSIWSERGRLDTFWSVTKDSNPTRRIGTAQEALLAFSDFKKYLHEQHRIRELFMKKNSVWYPDNLRLFLNDSLVNSDIGDLQPEGFFSRTHIRVGYVIERDSISGLQKETIQGRTQSLTLLRSDSKVISAYLGPFHAYDMRRRARTR